ncbi:MAG TPA: type II toxin-antitoxin system HicA family toxin [Patescibacteria group bacterium]|nr:type II toxin-antitoxin system HicA family toxin [Patescibacteria group bacterium]
MPPPDGCRETIEYLKTNRKSQTFEDLRKVLEDFGFVMHPRSGGSHRAFSRHGCFESPSLKQDRGPLLPAYVKSVIRALEEICDD